MSEKGYGYPEYTFRIPEEEDAENYTAALKEVFGNDIFNRFGEYYQMLLFSLCNSDRYFG